jgi:cytochrome c oxidase assembly protein Cox11
MSLSPFRTRLGALSVGALLLFATACVPATTLPDDCDADSVQREVTLQGQSLQPSTIEVCRDQAVTVRLKAETDAEVHFHGYDDQVPEQEVQAGETVTLTFDATHAGQFPIEIHPADGSEEVEAGTLVVNER